MVWDSREWLVVNGRKWSVTTIADYPCGNARGDLSLAVED